MNKRDAKKLAEQGSISIGELRGLIASARSKDGPSIVNPGLNKQHVLDILEGAIDGRNDEDVPVIWKPDPYKSNGSMKRTRDAMLVQNILRECG